MCYHIIAVRLSIGMPVSSQSKKVNLTQLKRNTKAKGNRKSGRKRPRPVDYDVDPAPDSFAKKKPAVPTTEEDMTMVQTVQAQICR